MNSTVAVVELVAVAVPIVGAPGTSAATALVAFEFALTADTALVAVTTQRIVFPTIVASSLIVFDV